MDALIRRAGSPDLDRLVALVAACFEPAWSAASIEGALRAREARAYVAQAVGPGGAPARRVEPRSLGTRPAEIARGESADHVGFVLARRILDAVEIDLVGVAPQARRRGLAIRMLEVLLEAERTRGAALAQLELSSGNEAASALYAGLGFVVVGRRPRYYPDGRDALLLSLELR
ncbi:MAG: GNAT family N-acetyltransferase [Deltaproteobacteria bacterium]|nr:GNAT family N-acetyltransferase [Deltaproteobacteria bacterium]